MTLLAVALGAFWLAKLVEGVITAPTWFWNLLKLALCVGGVVLQSGVDKWYAAFAAVGIVWFLDRLDDLSLVKADELAKRVLQRR